ncbi:hypothetical protein IC582_022971 [Cucumis melo]
MLYLNCIVGSDLSIFFCIPLSLVNDSLSSYLVSSLVSKSMNTLPLLKDHKYACFITISIFI